jgi:hypothetical protein
LTRPRSENLYCEQVPKTPKPQNPSTLKIAKLYY